MILHEFRILLGYAANRVLILLLRGALATSPVIARYARSNPEPKLDPAVKPRDDGRLECFGHTSQ